MNDSLKKWNKDRILRDYEYCYSYRVAVRIGTDTTLVLQHKSDDIKYLEDIIDIETGTTVKLEGAEIPKETATDLVILGKTINRDIYNHLWDKYTEIDNETVEENLDNIVWEYDITQEYTI